VGGGDDRKGQAKDALKHHRDEQVFQTRELAIGVVFQGRYLYFLNRNSNDNDLLIHGTI
jgi:hypothetical protein